ncbi:hypothetical protein JVX93_04160 [Mycolicibacterium boenickei]|nr:hypothetical protein JVX93_04160 [Mycolicibacterium boenickei]
MSTVAEVTALAEIGRRLALEFPELAPETVDSAVKQAHSRFDTSRIRDFVPLFVEKQARKVACPYSRGPGRPGGLINVPPVAHPRGFASATSPA